jgi:hypothetical protein
MGCTTSNPFTIRSLKARETGSATMCAIFPLRDLSSVFQRWPCFLGRFGVSRKAVCDHVARSTDDVESALSVLLHHETPRLLNFQTAQPDLCGKWPYLRNVRV